MSGRNWETAFAGLATPTVDILFVLDVTRSMRGELEAVKEVVTDFVEGIEQDEVKARVGLIAFRDRKIGQEQEVLNFNGEVFTQNSALFRQAMERLEARGGGDRPESSLDALLLATRQPFGAEHHRALVLITDAPPHIPDVEAQSVIQVRDAMAAASIDQLYIVTRAHDEACNAYYSLFTRIQGIAFDLGENDDFKARSENLMQTLRSLSGAISQNTRTLRRRNTLIR